MERPNQHEIYLLAAYQTLHKSEDMTLGQLNKLADSIHLTFTARKIPSHSLVGYGNKIRIFQKLYKEEYMEDVYWVIMDDKDNVIKTEKDSYPSYKYLGYNRHLKMFIFYTNHRDIHSKSDDNIITIHKYRIIDHKWTKLDSFDLTLRWRSYYIGQDNKYLYFHSDDRMRKREDRLIQKTVVIQVDISNNTRKEVYEFYSDNSWNVKQPIEVNDGKIYFINNMTNIFSVNKIASGENIASHSLLQLGVQGGIYPTFNLDGGYNSTVHSHFRLYFFDRFTIMTLSGRLKSGALQTRRILFDKDCKEVISNEVRDWSRAFQIE